MNERVDEDRMVMIVELIDDDGDEYEAELPIKFDVCGRCMGKGSHTNPNIGAITSEEWESDWDYEERERYVSGVYDVPCEECDGRRVMSVIDEKLCSPDNLQRYYDYLNDMADLRREEDMERRYGC